MPKIKIVSGGQTGVDRAVLDAPLQSNIKCGAGILMEEKKKIEKPPPHHPVIELQGADY